MSTVLVLDPTQRALVEQIEELLAEARSGELKGIVACVIDKDGVTGPVVAGDWPSDGDVYMELDDIGEDLRIGIYADREGGDGE